MKHLLLFLMLSLLLVACGSENTAKDTNQGVGLGDVPTLGAVISIPTNTPRAMPIANDDARFPIEPDPAGQALYETHCAACHGVNGEGQNPADPYARTEQGLLMAPPHDPSGHTWHHPDQQNFAAVWTGRHYPGFLPMPSFSTVLAVDEVLQILAYIKTWWGEEELAIQRDLSQRAKIN